MVNIILLNAIPAMLVVATLTLICWLPSRLDRGTGRAATGRPQRRPGGHAHAASEAGRIRVSRSTERAWATRVPRDG